MYLCEQRPEDIMTKLLFATSEIYPFIKTGGLADVSYSLPRALSQLNIDISIIVPLYKIIDKEKWNIKFSSEFFISEKKVTLLTTLLPNSEIPVYFVDIPEYYDREGGPYNSSNGDYADNHLRFFWFSKVIEHICVNDILGGTSFEIVHCNDWQTGLVPVLLSLHKERPKTIFTVHNMAYAGIFSRDCFNELDLPDVFFHHDRMEFYGNVSFLKSGIVFSDVITTVSPCYAEEIQQPEFGYGFDGLMRHRKSSLVGIINGIDEDEWNPERDGSIPYPFSLKNMSGKSKNKAYLQNMTGLTTNTKIPICSFVGRLVEQKGVEFVIDSIPTLIELGCQIVILGEGQAEYESTLLALASNYPTEMFVKVGYDESFAHLIEAGSDIFLMPSVFEPCGLNQLYSLAYGTLPIVTNRGGLKDSIIPYQQAEDLESATGFILRSPSTINLIETVIAALDVYKNEAIWSQLQRNAMSQNFGWNESAQHYIKLYNQLLM